MGQPIVFASSPPEPIPRPAPFAFALHVAAVDEALDFGVPAVVGEARGGEQGVFAVPAGMVAKVVEQVGGCLRFGWLESVSLPPLIFRPAQCRTLVHQGIQGVLHHRLGGADGGMIQ